MTETFDVAVAYARWKRAVDLLVREVVRRRREAQARQQESARAEQRVKNLRRIVRKALSEHSRIRLGRQR